MFRPHRAAADAATAATAAQSARAAGANPMVLMRLQEMMDQIVDQFHLNNAKEQAQAMKDNDGKDEFDDSISIG